MGKWLARASGAEMPAGANCTPPATDLYDIRPTPAAWNDTLADTLIAATLDRVSRWYATLPPGCPAAGPGWDRAEALVDAACAAGNHQALTDALLAYEQHAIRVFAGWPFEKECGRECDE